MTAEEFKQAFLDVWSERIEAEEARNQIIAAYPDNGLRTKYMLGDRLGADGGMLGDVAQMLGRKVHYEKNNIDCLYYHDIQGGNNLRPWVLDGQWPMVFDAIIEHENDNRIEDEWWKLHIYRAPLKVLIAHDYSEEHKRLNPIAAMWLSNKLEMLKEMAQVARDNWQGHSEDDDEYLVVIGNIGLEGELPQWTWWKLVETDNGCDFRDI